MRLSSLVVLLLFTVLRCSEAQDDDLKWTQTLSGVFPFLIASFFIIFSLFLIIFPQLALRTLMKEYLEEGHLIEGKVLSCETKAGSGGESFIAEIVYEAREHRYAHNSSLKFRNPEAWETKQLVRHYEVHEEIPRGEAVDMLLPVGPNNTRSGCPRIVVERILNEYSHHRLLMILIPGLILLAASVAMAIRAVLLMENQALGWCVLFGGLGLSVLVAFLYCTDSFLKSKRRRFDSARPFISSTEQAANVEARQTISRQQLLDPYAITFHEFAGHARATEKAGGAVRL